MRLQDILKGIHGVGIDRCGSPALEGHFRRWEAARTADASLRHRVEAGAVWNLEGALRAAPRNRGIARFPAPCREPVEQVTARDRRSVALAMAPSGADRVPAAALHPLAVSLLQGIAAPVPVALVLARLAD